MSGDEGHQFPAAGEQRHIAEEDRGAQRGVCTRTAAQGAGGMEISGMYQRNALQTKSAVHVRGGGAIEWCPIKHTPKYGHAFICMGTGRVHGDWEGAWGLGGCMGTGRVHGDWEGAWGLGGCMGTGRVHGGLGGCMGDWAGAWGLGGCMGTGRVHGDLEPLEGALSCLLMDGFRMGRRKVFVIARLGDKYGGTGEECG